MVEEINNHFYSGRTLTPDELEIMRFVRDKNQLNDTYPSQMVLINADVVK